MDPVWGKRAVCRNNLDNICGVSDLWLIVNYFLNLRQNLATKLIDIYIFI